MGDTIDNIKGRPGHRRKGARELIVHYGSLENLLAHAAEVKNKRYREGLLANMEAAPPEPRAGAHPHRRAGRVRRRTSCATAPGRARPPFAIFNELGFRALAKEYAPTADTIAKTYRIVNTADGVRALAERLRAAGRFAFRVLPDGATAMRAAIVGISFSTSPHDGRLRADRPPLARQHRQPAARDRAGGAAADPRGRGDREGRPRSEIRRHRARAPRRHARRPRPRHHAGELPARRDPVRAPDRGSRARAHQLQGADGGGRLRARRQGDLARRGAGRRGGGLRVRARRSRRAARAGPARPAGRGTADRRCMPRWSCRSSRC